MIKGMENLAYPFFKNSGFSKAGVIEDERTQKYGHQKGDQGFFVIDILNIVQYNGIEHRSRRRLWIAERALFRQPLI